MAEAKELEMGPDGKEETQTQTQTQTNTNHNTKNATWKGGWMD